MLPPHANDDERYGDRPPKLEFYIEEGTVGWQGDDDSVSRGNDFPDGMTLIKVTLFIGHEQGKPLADDGKSANGMQIAARLASFGGLWSCPKRGARVVVAFPGGRTAAGNGVIIAVVGQSPKAKLGRKKTLLDFGDDDVVISSAKSITLLVESPEDDGSTKRHQISLSGQGGVQVLSEGSGLFTKDGEINLKTLDDSGNLKQAIVMTQSETSVTDHSAAPTATATLTLSGGSVSVLGAFVTVTWGGSASFSKLNSATPATPFLVGPSGFAAVPCLSMYGSAT